MNNQVLIIVNPYCHQGKGWQRWLSIQDDVLSLLPSSTNVLILEKNMQLKDILPGLVSSSQPNCVISAGGDGSIHYLLNTIFKTQSIDSNNLRLGAIGLGSSNDFLKPFKDCIHNIPLRINYKGSCIEQDVGFVKYLNVGNEIKEKYFIVNASFGLTAEANWNFNHPGRILRFLKKTSTSSAIMYTALNTMISYKNFSCSIHFDQEHIETSISNINILKSPYVSGSFRYNQDLLPDDGHLGLNICLGMDKWQLLSTMYHLGNGRFGKHKKRLSESIKSFELISPEPIIFECDGETEKAREVQITVRPKLIKILNS